MDPLAQQYAYYTPYQFAGNMPIQATDLDGLEPEMKTGQPARDNNTAQDNLAGYDIDKQYLQERIKNFREFSSSTDRQLVLESGVYSKDDAPTPYGSEGAYQTQVINESQSTGEVWSKKVVHFPLSGQIEPVDDPFTAGLPFMLEKALVRMGQKVATEEVALGVKGGTKTLPMLSKTTIQSVLSSAQALDKNGLSAAGRALQKHAGRPGPFNSIKFSRKIGNQQGLDVLKSILNSKSPIIQNAGNGGYRIFDGATGRGFGLSRIGLFNGFRELP